MGRIFLSAGHGGVENGVNDAGAIAGGTTETQEMILLRDQIVSILRSQGVEVLSVPDDLDTNGTISWINSRGRLDDVALEIHADSFASAALRGASVFHIANNDERKGHAEILLFNLLRQVPQLPSQGVKPDTQSALGSLPFCRQTVIPSLLMQVGSLSNAEDRFILQNQRRDLAQGIAEGLTVWSRAVNNQAAAITPTPTATATATTTTTTTTASAAPQPLISTQSLATVNPPPGTVYPGINIRINGATYPEQGLIINGNSYVPVDLVDQLGINVATDPNIYRVRYGNVVYVKAVDLRRFTISVSWENPTRTVVLRSLLQICPGQVDRIMGSGNTSEVQLRVFLEARNPTGLTRFPDLPKLFREEATIEGVNYDVAFAQMCVETGFLTFGGTVQPTQNNFGGLGAVGNNAQGASFPSARIGVRAQVQHLKAYASTAPLVQEIVDPRFRFVARGIAPLIDQLSGRWAADPKYGEKIVSVLRQLYESAGIL